jgi:serine/threonine protein kinase
VLSDVPPDPAEVPLAEFLDETQARLERGESVDSPSLGNGGHFVARAGSLLADLHLLLSAVGGLREQQAQFEDDLHELSTVDTSLAPEPQAEEKAPPDPFPGEFRLRRRLGQGAFGVVWLADDLRLERAVALKVIHPSRRPGTEALTRLLAEARLLAAIDHPHVVRVHDYRQSADGAPWLVLQYVPGGSLADRVTAEGPLPWAAAARHLADVGAGLLELHRRGIVHRDIKPANLLWHPQRDEVLLTDLGISARLAAAGGAGGTPFYMPPEAFDGEVSPGQDVYGLAASLFWLTTGSVPFPGPGAARVQAQARAGLPDPDPRCAGLPPALEGILRAGLAADLARRPSLAVFVARLRASLNQLLADALLPTGPGPVRLLIRALAPGLQAGARLRDLRPLLPEPGRLDVHTGDQLHIEVELALPGYVTVFNVGPGGLLHLLHPLRPGPAVPLPAGRPVPVARIQVSPPAGSERLVAVWARLPMALGLDELLRVADGGAGGADARATRGLMAVRRRLAELPPTDWSVDAVELNHLPTTQEGQR